MTSFRTQAARTRVVEQPANDSAGLRAAAFLFALVAAFAITFAGQARATDVQRVISPGGIEAWLVEDTTNPLIAFSFAFTGGSNQDPDGKDGAARLMSGLLDEGAGDLDSKAFQDRLEDLSVRLSYSVNGDNFRGTVLTLSANLDEAMELFRLSLSEPRFDAEPMERIRNRMIVGMRRAETDPDSISADRLFELIYGDHPYGRDNNGTEESLGVVTADDLHALHKRLFARDNVKIGVVGDISADVLEAVLDRVFGALPEAADLRPVAEAPFGADGGTVDVSELAVPQSSIQFALPGIKRDDPDYMTAHVVNHIFGGGGFSSRLFEEVREKRGLVYSVYAYLYPFDHGALLIGGAGTQNARVAETMDVIRAEVERMGAEGPSADDLEKAKRFLTGAYALRFDTSGKIANQLVGLQLDNLGIDYFDRRNVRVEAVTLEDAKRVAARLFDPDTLIFTIAGAPAGVESTLPETGSDG
ncbi:MAG: pitrilysin family protein [Pseudomonadota bacterium]